MACEMREIAGGLWLWRTDALTAPEGVLRVWSTAWMQERTLPALRALLALEFEHVIVSHGEPVHDRAAFERALEIEPWAG